MKTVEIYVVRLYRRESSDFEIAEGVVEFYNTGRTAAFRSKSELTRLLFGPEPEFGQKTVLDVPGRTTSHLEDLSPVSSKKKARE